MSIPIFNGFLFSARAHEADYRASALQQQVRDLRDKIARDVRVTWLQSNTAYQRVSVTAQLLQQANLALDLAQTRYKLGLSSIVELSQAQLQQTDAQIGNTNARYEYLTTLSALNFQMGK
jgi:outer membrane protein